MKRRFGLSLQLQDRYRLPNIDQRMLTDLIEITATDVLYLDQQWPAQSPSPAGKQREGSVKS
jgi:hypothetical protein